MHLASGSAERRKESTAMRRTWGGIEGGGTKFVCVLGSGPDDVLARAVIPTTTPGETLAAAARFFIEQLDRPNEIVLTGLGIACFGPLDLDPNSPGYGTITTTPKPGWAGTDVMGYFRARFAVPTGFDTDVNAAALAEQRWGAARGLGSVVYFTVGTGIGGGALVAGRPLHGLTHPEMGHIPIAPLPGHAALGVCPFHGGRCLEGVASGPALAARAGRPAADLAPDDPIWQDEAYYLAYAATVATLLLAPQRIIFGGGVLAQRQLFPLIRAQTLDLLHGYVSHPAITAGIETYIAPPLLGANAGALGALALARAASGEPAEQPGRRANRPGSGG
jgi:fructokinase